MVSRITGGSGVAPGAAWNRAGAGVSGGRISADATILTEKRKARTASRIKSFLNIMATFLTGTGNRHILNFVWVS